jgi:hypothetical protein
MFAGLASKLELDKAPTRRPDPTDLVAGRAGDTAFKKSKPLSTFPQLHHAHRERREDYRAAETGALSATISHGILTPYQDASVEI